MGTKNKNLPLEHKHYYYSDVVLKVSVCVRPVSRDRVCVNSDVFGVGWGYGGAASVLKILICGTYLVNIYEYMPHSS